MDKNPGALSKSSLLLLVDRQNILGTNLSAVLDDIGTVVLVSQEKLEKGAGIFIPFSLPVPKIPEGVYSRIIFVWDEESKHILDPLMKKAEEWHSPLFVVLPEEDESALEQVRELDVTVLVLGDIFGAPRKQPLDELLSLAKATKRIRLSGMGLHAWHPVWYGDAVKKIADVVVSARVVGKIFLVGPSHQMTALGIAHLLQKIDPDILVDFSGKEEERQRHRFVSIFDAYNAGERLREYFKMLRVNYYKENKKEASIVFPKQPLYVRKKKGKGWYVIYVFLILLLLPFVLIGGSGGLGMLFLSSGISDAERGHLASAKQKMDAAVAAFSFVETSSDALFTAGSAVLKVTPLDTLHKQVGIGSRLALAVDEALTAGEQLSLVLAGKSSDVQGDVESAVSNLKHVSLALSVVSQQDVPQPFQGIVAKAKIASSVVGSVVDELPQLLGTKGDRKYLILFQNNMELRPGGGFIGSYGLLSLHNGAITSFTIHDVYDADGQLKGHVEPPFAIRRYIPIVHLYLRDSNFDGDFTNDAKAAAYMLSQETGDKVDGVVGIDLYVLRGILASVGSVYVPSYGQTVTEANFFQILEQHAEKNFFPGSTQKKDFLNAFTSALLSHLQRGFSGQTLLAKIADAIQQKHVAFGFADPSIQTPFTLANLSGSLKDFRETATFNDFFGIIEANLGINKVNAFVTRKVSQDVNIQANGDVNETIFLSLTNNSDGSWPGGIYKNYIRAILPKNAQLTTVSLDNIDQKIVPAITDPKVYEAKTFIAPRGLEVAREEESGKAVYGFLVNIPMQTTMEIAISYTIPHVYEDSLEKSYSLMVWKQMGIDSYQYHLHVSYPEGQRVLTASPIIGQGDQWLEYNGLIASDTEFTFSLTKK